METYTTNSFCNKVFKIQTPFPMLKITFLYKFFLLLSLHTIYRNIRIYKYAYNYKGKGKVHPRIGHKGSERA